ncbi:DUF4923 family protein [Parabacteroides sp. AF17-28]|mgnify:FL=1|uniref:DUF4923 family protein n=1 Tax=Parabacteroides sp. AF17-28 TaxID=2292241 RepID=UPI000F004F04|nr:DUF4923 family protein [Parabacteroides sp. AF17-28]RHR55903.1 DUF4923 family protein [Parabacteroides sp. AF17-28]
MKKNWVLGVAVCGILSVSDAAYGQSIKDILNSAAVKDAVTAVTGGKKLTVENLAGTWTYVNPGIQLEGDNALKNVAASVAASEMEKKLKEYCAKVGIVEGAFNYTFNSDSTFTNVLKGKTLKGTYSFNPDEKTMELHYGKIGKSKLTTMTAHVVLSNDELSLLFDADKLLDFLTKLSAVSKNTTLQALNKLASQYDGMMLGFELKK